MRSLVMLLLFLCPFALSQPPALKVSLPCESTMQLLASNGNYAAVECTDRTWHILSIPSGKVVHSFAAKPGVTSYAFSRDGEHFIAGYADGAVEIVTLASSAKSLKWHAGSLPIDVVGLLSDLQIAIVAPHEQAGEVWQLEPTPKRIAALPTDFSGLTFVAASPNGKLLAAGGTDTTVRLYDTSTWKSLHEFRKLTLEPFAGAFTSDGKYLLVGGADTQITVIDPQSGSDVRRLPASPGVVDMIVPETGDKRIITHQWDADGKQPPFLGVWDMHQGFVKKLDSPHPITGGGIVKDAVWIASASGKQMNVWTDQSSAAGN
jgi:WD40 repeat protein